LGEEGEGRERKKRGVVLSRAIKRRGDVAMSIGGRSGVGEL
jgi:hypothetical protein